MTDPLDSVLIALEQFGKTNDASTAERTRRMLNVTRDTGEFLAVLVRATLARRVLEIGTSNGYSTLWLANAARTIGGSVTTVELADYKIGLAAANFARAPFIGPSGIMLGVVPTGALYIARTRVARSMGRRACRTVQNRGRRV